MRIASKRAVTRLGKNLIKTACIDDENAEITIATLIKFKAICNEYNVSRIIAIGTSALRDAKNSTQFLGRVREETGIDITVISGHREADLTLKGIKGSSVCRAGLLAITDVGGGSTELIVCDDKCIKSSIDVGAVKLFEQFIKNDPPTDYELSEIKAYVTSKLSSTISPLRGKVISPVGILVATGGTSTTLASIHLNLSMYDGAKVHGHILTYRAVSSILEELKMRPLKERALISGVHQERADIIIPGTIIVLSIMELLNAKELMVSDYGLMEGVLFESSVKDSFDRVS